MVLSGVEGIWAHGFPFNCGPGQALGGRGGVVVSPPVRVLGEGEGVCGGLPSLPAEPAFAHPLIGARLFGFPESGSRHSTLVFSLHPCHATPCITPLPWWGPLPLLAKHLQWQAPTNTDQPQWTPTNCGTNNADKPQQTQINTQHIAEKMTANPCEHQQTRDGMKCQVVWKCLHFTLPCLLLSRPRLRCIGAEED